MGKWVFFILVILLNAYNVEAQDSELQLSIEGNLLMSDKPSLHIAVPVEALRLPDSVVSDTVLSNENGQYRTL